jgi:hypothetical protein
MRLSRSKAEILEVEISLSRAGRGRRAIQSELTSALFLCSLVPCGDFPYSAETHISTTHCFIRQVLDLSGRQQQGCFRITPLNARREAIHTFMPQTPRPAHIGSGSSGRPNGQPSSSMPSPAPPQCHPRPRVLLQPPRQLPALMGTRREGAHR